MPDSDPAPGHRPRLLRRLLLAGGVVVVLVAGVGYAAVASTSGALEATGPTAVTGADASAVFRIADRTVRQVRYRDGAVLDYRFRLANAESLAVTVTGIAEAQHDERLFGYLALEDAHGSRTFEVPAKGSREVHLRLRMGGCESLSARAGSFAHDLLLDTERFGVRAGAVEIELPEELHTGSPREVACPRATAESRPPG